MYSMEHFKGDISTLSQHQLETLISLKFPTNATQNMAEFFRENVETLKSLKILDISGQYEKPNLFASILLENINLLTGLESLDCSFCCLDELPSFNSLKALKVLCCTNNKLKCLPDDIDVLNSLEKFDCSCCDLKYFPPSLLNLEKLKELNCDWNNNLKLPLNIGKLTSLQYLNCTHCGLTVIPTSICDLQNLKILNCGWNDLQNLPERIENLLSLKTLYCDHNKLSSLPLLPLNVKMVYCGNNSSAFIKFIFNKGL